MQHGLSPAGSPAQAARRRRLAPPWLIGMIAGTLLGVASYAIFVHPVVAKAKLIRLIEAEGGIVQTHGDGPEWLRSRLPDGWKRGTDAISAVCLFPHPGRERLTRQVARELRSEEELIGLQMDLTADELRALSSLNISFVHLPSSTPEGTVATLLKFENLERVTLDDSSISNELLLQLTQLPKMKSLELRNCDRLTDEGMAGLQGNTKLHDVRFDDCDGLGDGAIQVAATWPALRVLDIVNGARVTDEGIAALRTSRLTVLQLHDCPGIRGSGFEALAGHPTLEALDVSGAVHGDGFADHLHRMTNLERVTLYNTGVSVAAAERLRASLPHCGVRLRFDRPLIP